MRQSYLTTVLIVLSSVLSLITTTEATDTPLGKIFIKAAPAKVDGQEFVDQELQNSVKDLKGKAKKFVLAESEADADFLLVVVKRETKLGQPHWLKHKTPRNVNDLYATLSLKVGDEWKPGIQLSSNGCCKFWSDAAAKVMSNVEKWIKQQHT